MSAPNSSVGPRWLIRPETGERIDAWDAQWEAWNEAREPRTVGTITMAEYAERYLNPVMARFEADFAADWMKNTFEMIPPIEHRWYDFALPLLRFIDAMAA